MSPKRLTIPRKTMNRTARRRGRVPFGASEVAAIVRLWVIDQDRLPRDIAVRPYAGITVRRITGSSRRRLLIRHPEHGVRQPALEARVVAEQTEQIGVVLHQPDDDAPERLVVLDPGVLLVRVFPCILVGGIDGDLLRDLL